MTKVIDPIGTYFCNSLRHRLAGIRTQMEWLTSGATPALPMNEELDGLASKIWDLERMLMDIAQPSKGNTQSVNVSVANPEPKVSNNAAVVQLGGRNDSHPLMRSNAMRTEAVA